LSITSNIEACAAFISLPYLLFKQYFRPSLKSKVTSTTTTPERIPFLVFFSKQKKLNVISFLTSVLFGCNAQLEEQRLKLQHRVQQLDKQT
jgi:hypothetical protein